MTGNPVRVALIGCGIHARTVLLPALSIAGARIVGCYDQDPDRAASVAAQFGFEPAGDLDQLIATGGIEAAVVATSAEAHVDTVRTLASNRIPTFVEKPCGVSAADLVQLVHDLEADQTPVQVGYMRRYAPPFRQLRQLSRQWAKPLAMQVAVAVGPIESHQTFVNDVAVHHLDLVRWILGDPVAVEGRYVAMAEGAVVQAVLTGRHGVATAYLSSAGSWGHATELVGVQSGQHLVQVANASELTYMRLGRQEVNDDRVERLADVGQLRSVPNLANPRLLNSSLYLQGYVPQMTAFLRAVRLHAPVTPTPADGLATFTLAEQLSALALEGTRS